MSKLYNRILQLYFECEMHVNTAAYQSTQIILQDNIYSILIDY